MSQPQDDFESWILSGGGLTFEEWCRWRVGALSETEWREEAERLAAVLHFPAMADAPMPANTRAAGAPPPDGGPRT